MNAAAAFEACARGLQIGRASLEGPSPEAGMVRNPRTLMVCSLLALATGMALGSRMTPATVGLTPAASPGTVDRVAAWGRPAWASAIDAPPDTSVPVAAAPAVPADPQAGIEGARQPRSPRMSRETMARVER